MRLLLLILAMWSLSVCGNTNVNNIDIVNTDSTGYWDNYISKPCLFVENGTYKIIVLMYDMKHQLVKQMIIGDDNDK